MNRDLPRSLKTEIITGLLLGYTFL